MLPRQRECDTGIDTAAQRCPTCGSSVRVITGGEGTSYFKSLSEPYCPDTYVAPIDGGYVGYQARCWACEWEGPLRGPSRRGKREAREDAENHGAE